MSSSPSNMVKTEQNKISTAAAAAAAAAASDNKIAIKIISQDGNHVGVKMSRTTKLAKVMEAFCKRKGLQLEYMSFTFDHKKVGEEQTPEQLGMEDGAEMEAHKSAFGA